jgi:hypothetical protein
LAASKLKTPADLVDLVALGDGQEVVVPLRSSEERPDGGHVPEHPGKLVVDAALPVGIARAGCSAFIRTEDLDAVEVLPGLFDDGF